MARYERRLARSLAGVINILDPDVVVLAGGLSNIERFYRKVPALWAEHVFSDRVDTRLVRSLHGDSSGVRGRPGCGAATSRRPEACFVRVGCFGPFLLDSNATQLRGRACARPRSRCR